MKNERMTESDERVGGIFPSLNSRLKHLQDIYRKQESPVSESIITDALATIAAQDERITQLTGNSIGFDGHYPLTNSGKHIPEQCVRCLGEEIARLTKLVRELCEIWDGQDAMLMKMVESGDDKLAAFIQLLTKARKEVE